MLYNALSGVLLRHVFQCSEDIIGLVSRCVIDTAASSAVIIERAVCIDAVSHSHYQATPTPAPAAEAPPSQAQSTRR